MKQYLELLSTIMERGIDLQDRTGIGSRCIFGYLTRYNLDNTFPLVTTKKVHLKSIIYELLWFISGNTNIQYLIKNDIRIWNEWAYQVYIEKNNLQKKFPRYSEAWKAKMCEFVEQVKEQLTRTPRPLPTLKINPEVKDIFAFKYEDFVLEGYDP